MLLRFDLYLYRHSVIIHIHKVSSGQRQQPYWHTIFSRFRYFKSWWFFSITFALVAGITHFPTKDLVLKFDSFGLAHLIRAMTLLSLGWKMYVYSANLCFCKAYIVIPYNVRWQSLPCNETLYVPSSTVMMSYAKMIISRKSGSISSSINNKKTSTPTMCAWIPIKWVYKMGSGISRMTCPLWGTSPSLKQIYWLVLWHISITARVQYAAVCIISIKVQCALESINALRKASPSCLGSFGHTLKIWNVFLSGELISIAWSWQANSISGLLGLYNALKILISTSFFSSNSLIRSSLSSIWAQK